MIQNILINAILGAAAGYITNDSAINMLFDEKGIGKLKIGGVVVKTREEFEDQISTLVENEIINPENLKKSLENEEFFKTMKPLFSKYFNEELSLNIEDKEFLDLNNFSTTEKNILNFIKNNKENISKKIVENVGNNLELKDLIGEEQALNISNNIFDEIFKIAEKEEIIENYLLEIYKEIGNKELEEITTKEPIYILSEEMSKRVPNLINYLKNKKDFELNEILNKILENSKITLAFENFEENLKKQSIENILGAEKTTKLQKEAINLLKEYINSSKGDRNIENISENILDYLKTLDISILDFMNSDVKKSFESFSEKTLPEIIEQIIIWIRKNDEQIENAIEESINEVIKESGLIKENILTFIKKHLGNITRRYSLVGKIIERIKASKNDKELAETLTKELIEYLNNTKIKDIISSMNISTSREMAKLIKKNLSKALDNNLSHIIPLDQIKMEYLLPENLTTLIKTYILSEFINLKSTYIYSDKYINIFQKEIREKILSFKNQNIYEIIDEEKYEEIIKNLSKNLYEVIKSKKKDITKEMCMDFYKGIKKNKINDLISEDIKNSITDKIHNNLVLKLEDMTYNLERNKIKDYVDKIKQMENVDDKATNIFIKGLVDNLPILIEGNIKNIVQKNLVNLDNDELKEMMREFMGKELKPLNNMGAVLGGITGGVLGILDSKYDISLLANIGTYATIGVLTNCIAIYGIFKPYESNKLLKMATLGKLDKGVIPKQKEQFAKNMSKFVERKLLNKDFLEITIQEKKDSLKEFIFTEIKNKKYTLIDKNIEDNKEIIVDYIIKKSREFILDNKEKLSSMLVNNLENLYMDELGIDDLRDKLKNIKITDKFEAEILIQKEVKKFLLGNKQIKNFIEKKDIENLLKNNMSLYIEKFIDTKLKNDTLLKELNKHLKNYDPYLNKNLNEFLNVNKIFDSIKNRFLDYDEIGQFLYIKTDELVKKEFKENKEIRDIFDGKLINFMHKNVETLSKNLINKIQKEIINNEENLKNYCIEELHKSLYDGEGIFGSIGNFFKKTANSAIGGDELVKNIIGKSISKTIKILENNQDDIKKIFNNLLEEIGKTKISYLGLKFDSNKIENIIKKVIGNKEFQNIFEGSFKNILEFTFDKSIKSYLNAIDIRNFSDIILIFQEYLLEMFENSSEFFKKNSESIFVQPLCNIILELVQEKILELKMKDIFSNLKENEISNISHRIYSSLIETEAFKDNYIKLIDESLTTFENKKINTIINFDIFEKDIKKIIKNLSSDPNILHSIYCKDEFIIKNIKNILKNIDEKTLDEVLEMLLDPFIKVNVENIGLIFDSLNISKLTYTEIKNMENSKLHNMFNSFAGRYFEKLKLYGVWGGIFAIPYLNYSLIGYSGYKLINNHRKNKKISSEK